MRLGGPGTSAAIAVCATARAAESAIDRQTKGRAAASEAARMML
jgi:hypothetical protein